MLTRRRRCARLPCSARFDARCPCEARDSRWLDGPTASESARTRSRSRRPQKTNGGSLGSKPPRQPCRIPWARNGKRPSPPAAAATAATAATAAMRRAPTTSQRYATRMLHRVFGARPALPSPQSDVGDAFIEANGVWWLTRARAGAGERRGAGFDDARGQGALCKVRRPQAVAACRPRYARQAQAHRDGGSGVQAD